eukprot:contig_7421_g1741
MAATTPATAAAVARAAPAAAASGPSAAATWSPPLSTHTAAAINSSADDTVDASQDATAAAAAASTATGIPAAATSRFFSRLRRAFQKRAKAAAAAARAIAAAAARAREAKAAAEADAVETALTFTNAVATTGDKLATHRQALRVTGVSLEAMAGALPSPVTGSLAKLLQGRVDAAEAMRDDAQAAVAAVRTLIHQAFAAMSKMASTLKTYRDSVATTQALQAMHLVVAHLQDITREMDAEVKLVENEILAATLQLRK